MVHTDTEDPTLLMRRRFGPVSAQTLGAAPMSPIPEHPAAKTDGPAHLDIPLATGWEVAGQEGTTRTVTLPHSVVDQSWQQWRPDRWESTWLYRTRFTVPANTGDYRYLLRLDGALSSATPIVNGHRLRTHRGGYLPFEYEVTDQVGAGANRLEVLLDGGFDVDVPPDRPGEPSSTVDFWQPAGIYRGVTLRAVPQVYLADVFAVPRQVLDPAARHLDVHVELDGTIPSRAARVELRLLDGARIVGAGSVGTSGFHSRRTVTAKITGLARISLWDLDDPKLYRLSATLVVEGVHVHEYRVPVGFRQAEFGKSGFFLNGRKRTLLGLNRHQFYPFAGAAMPARVQRGDARILKELNCSMVRCSHYPQHEAFLDACDELGILVFAEVPGWGYLGDKAWREHVVEDVHDMIVRDRNHPSIVLWGVRLNETPGDSDLYESTQRIAKALDDSRQTTGAIIGSDYATTEFQQDVFSYNDYDATTNPSGQRLPRLKPPRSDFPMLVSEAVGTLSGPAVFYRRTDPIPDQHGQALAHAMVHEQGAADPRYCGVLGWCGFDYPSGNGNQYHGVKYPGVIDQFRVPKLGAAVYAAQVDPRRRAVIEPAFYWDFTGHYSVRELGSDALIFANADRLRLTVGGKFHAELEPDTARFPHLPYPPFRANFVAVQGNPELRIDAYLAGEHLATRRFSAEPATDRLLLTPDDDAIAADGVDATRVAVRITDRYGAPRPGRAGQVRFTLSGPGELIGDNPFPLAETGGAAAVWLRGVPGKPGVVRLLAEHDNLPATWASITTGNGSTP
jgi:beta-galactosidase